MADTYAIRKEIEPYVRDWLSGQFQGHVFTEQNVNLEKWGGKHKFDAVSQDRTVIANILSNRPRTRSGNINSGGIKKAESDLLRFHCLGEGITKVLVFTDKKFKHLIEDRTKWLGINTLTTLHCPLPKHLSELLDNVLDEASLEQKARTD